ncbi:PRC-barrel domain-containing protein [Ornithinimicrobium sp. LYQ103]|uniref:PRC-barrel domain-containing protein n=1 Tax=Ornithinimicrobium sp. LYQ103 TaxID=3378796 RepID=UPI0038520323
MHRSNQEADVVISHEQLNMLYDAEVVDQDGEKVGAMGQIYLDNATGEPAWITVRTGWFGGRRVFVPLTTAEVLDGQIRCAYSMAKIKGAPDIEVDGHLSEADEQDLDAYYAVDEGPMPSA